MMTQADIERLDDPVHVGMLMMRGDIAKPLLPQIEVLYDDELRASVARHHREFFEAQERTLARMKRYRNTSVVLAVAVLVMNLLNAWLNWG